MKTEGRQTKLLAAVAIIAMVVCALAIVLPSNGVFAADGDVQESTDVTADTGSAELDPEVHSASLTIGETTTYYETLVAAWDVAVNQTEPATIVLLKDETGGGLQSISDKGANVTLDLGGNTYTATSDPAGSTGTKNQGMQLLRGNTFLIMNGTFMTVTGEDGAVKNGINVYCDTELRDVTLDFSQSNGDGEKFNGLQLANGVVKITGSTSIIDRPEDYTIAFFANWSSYTSGSQVTIDTTGTIDGVIAIADYNANEGCGNSSLDIVNMGVTENTVIKYEFTASYGFDLTVSDNVSVDVAVDNGYQIAGTVTFGDSSTTFSKPIAAGDGGIELSKGSIIITGTIVADQEVVITASGDVTLADGTTITGGDLIIEESEDGTNTIIIESLTISSGGSLTIPNGVSVDLTGTITVAEESEPEAEDAGSLYIAGEVTGNGTINGQYTKAANAIIGEGITSTSEPETDASSYNAFANNTTSGNGVTGIWELRGNQLILTDYTGSMYFYSTGSTQFTEVVLNGTNVITIDAGAVEAFITTGQYFGAIRSGELTISAGTNGGSLSIEITGAVDLAKDMYVAGIMAGTLTINADVTVVNSMSKAVGESQNEYTLTNYEIQAGVNSTAAGTMTIGDGVNVDADVRTFTLTNNGQITAENVSVGTSITNDGIIIVTDTLDYDGTSIFMVNDGLPMNPAAGNLYLYGADVTQGSQVTIRNTTDAIAIGDNITTVPSVAFGSEDDYILVVDGSIDLGDNVYTVSNNVTITGTVYGNVTLDGGSITIAGTTAEQMFTVNGIGIATNDPVTISENSGVEISSEGAIAGTITADESAPITIGAGTVVEGLDIVGNGTTINLAGVTAGDNGITVSAGSVIISGDIVLNGETSESEVIVDSDNSLGTVQLGDANITGTGTIVLDTLIINGEVTVGEGVIIEVNTGMTINEGAIISGDGLIELGENVTVTNNGEIDITIEGASPSITIDGSDSNAMQKFIDALQYYGIIIVDGDLNLQNPADEEYTEIYADGKSIYVSGTLTVGENVYLDFNGVTFYGGTYGSTEAGDIDVYGEFTISSSHVYADVTEMVIDEDTGETGVVTVAVPLSMGVTGDDLGLRDVGYGNILNVDGTFTQSGYNTVSIFGTLNIDGSLVVGENATIVVYGGGDINVSGTMTLNGTLDLYGEGTVSGAMTVGTTGVLDTIDEVNAVVGGLDVAGTLTFNGTLSGQIINYGTVTFSGVGGANLDSDVDGMPAVIYAMDGSITNVLSVEDTLYISDFGAAEELTPDNTNNRSYVAEDGNIVSITDMNAVTGGTGVTIGVSVSSETEGNTTTYTAIMDVSGTANGTIEFSADAYAGIVVSQTFDVSAQTVNDELIGSLKFEGPIDITGTVNAARGVTVNNDHGILTVTGELTLVQTGTTATVLSGTVNATHYTIATAASGTTPAYVTSYYTSFDAAVEQIANADNDRITVMGEQEATVDATIDNGETVIVSDDSKLTIGSGITVTVATGGVLRDNAYELDIDEDPLYGVFVDGTLTFQNFATGYTHQDRNAVVFADVVVINEPARTYMSLAGAIAAEMTDITLNQDVVIEEDLTIPAGITVSSDEFGITVKPGDANSDVTLTVEGAVELTFESPGIVLGDKTVTGSSGTTTTYEGVIVVGGTDGYVMMPTIYDSTESEYDAAIMDEESIMYDANSIAGAHYLKEVTVDRQSDVHYVVSTLMHAADDSANVYSADDATAEIIVTGQITVDTLEFTVPEDIALSVRMGELNTETDSSLRFSEIALGNGVSLESNGYELTGAVVMQDADGNIVSEVTLSRAVGITVMAHTETDDNDVETDCMEVSGIITAGSVTIGAGSVTVDGTLEVRNGTIEGVRYTGSLTVVNGATLVVPYGDSMESSAVDGTALTVDGTISVEGTLELAGAVINGTVTATEDGKVTVNTVQLNGTIDIVTVNDGDEAVLSVIGVLTVGAKPTELGVTAGAGTINGKVIIDADGYIRAYPGADLSGAQINVNAGVSEMDSLAFVINGETYMTIYVDEGYQGSVANILDVEQFDLLGLDVGLNYHRNVNETLSVNTGLYQIGNWYSNESMAGNTALSGEPRDDNTATKVTEYDTVYAHAEPATVTGTFSVGVGLRLYVDDVPVTSSNTAELTVGDHTVRFELEASYNGDNAVISFNGQTVQNGGAITIDVADTTFNLTASGAVPATPGSGDVVVNVPSENDDMSLTDILLIVLVILIIVMAIIVALRLMRS